MASIDWLASWPRLFIWIISRVVFSALPLIMNVLVWLLVRSTAAWPPFQIEDLCYFAILLASETLLSLREHLQFASTRGLLSLCLLIIASLGAATLLGFSHHEQADPRTNSPFSGDAQRILTVAAVIAIGTLIMGAFTQFILPRHDPAAVPKLDIWLAGRIGSAHLPILFSAFFWSLTSKPYKIFRVNDLCFLAIALAGPAIMDMVSSPASRSMPRLVTLSPLLLIIISASLVLGCWYFTSARPPEPGLQGALATNLLSVAAVSAFSSIVAAIVVHRQLRVHSQPAKE